MKSFSKEFLSIVFLFIAVVSLLIILNYDARVNSEENLAVDTLKESCNDTNWLDIEMIDNSYFHFDPPTDSSRWERAKLLACRGEQILLKQSLKYFPNFMDFLDGDIRFRKYNLPADIFVDKEQGMSFLTNHPKPEVTLNYSWQIGMKKVIPDHYDFPIIKRAPIVKLGYFAFSKEQNSQYFEGKPVGEVGIEKNVLYNQWRKIKDDLNTSFILIHSSNENWGLLSTWLPNRTTTWGSCCYHPKHKTLFDILNHPNLLAFFVNQHYNLTHPKLISFPRGMPIGSPHSKKVVWDSMRHIQKNLKKTRLVFQSSSSWGPRPQITACVAKKFSSNDFSGHIFGKKSRYSPAQYHLMLGGARMGIALPGLGYDTFRLWEMLTFGLVPVIEKGTGLDKTLWRLPALIVEDFDEVTPELLRKAYVEAIYHAEDFEYERLTQSFWFSLLANISISKSSQPVYDKFPPTSEDPGFARPLVPYNCGPLNNECGPGTKRTPKSSC